MIFLLFSHIYVSNPFSKPWVYYSKLTLIFKNPRCIFSSTYISFSLLDQIFFKTLENSFKILSTFSKISRFDSSKSLSVSPAFYLILLISSLPQYHFNGVRFSRCCLSPRSCLLSDSGWIPGSAGHPVSSFLPSVVLFLVRHLLTYVPRPLG